MQKKILIACIIFILGCEKKNNFVYNVSAEFEPYVQKFITEAKTRGLNININNLILKYDSTISPSYCATSNVTSLQNDVQKIILINPRKCWQNNAQLETLIFHELGHCILGRNHDTSLMPKGDPKTIMCPDNLTIYSPCVYSIGSPCDFLYRRGYYIDELFNSLTPVPDWAK
jgi:hypothetical protein